MKRCVLHDLDESARKGLSEMSKQEWRTIEEYEGIYEISNDGRIRSIRRLVNGVPRGGKELKVSKMKSGIYCIRLKGLDGKLHFELITRLVAKAFIKIFIRIRLNLSHTSTIRFQLKKDSTVRTTSHGYRSGQDRSKRARSRYQHLTQKKAFRKSLQTLKTPKRN